MAIPQDLADAVPPPLRPHVVAVFRYGSRCREIVEAHPDALSIAMAAHDVGLADFMQRRINPVWHAQLCMPRSEPVTRDPRSRFDHVLTPSTNGAAPPVAVPRRAAAPHIIRTSA